MAQDPEQLLVGIGVDVDIGLNALLGYCVVLLVLGHCDASYAASILGEEYLSLGEVFQGLDLVRETGSVDDGLVVKEGEVEKFLGV